MIIDLRSLKILLVSLGPPEKPYNLEITDITHDSAKLRWTSGYDMGFPQHFLVLRYEGDGSMGGYYTVYIVSVHYHQRQRCIFFENCRDIN